MKKEIRDIHVLQISAQSLNRRGLLPVALLILCLLVNGNVLAQANKTDTLRDILIKDKKTESLSVTQIIDNSILKQYQNTSLQQVLQLHSNVFVKNYGVGALSAISIRGSSAAQTAVIWHGMNINNAMTGISDFSILPVALFNEIKINYSGSTGNAPGGNIALTEEQTAFKKASEVNVGAAYESLHNSASYASIAQSGSKYVIKIKGFYQQSKNQFKYYNSEKEQFEQLVHAHSKSKGILADFSLKIFPNQILFANFWTQESNREIPPALFEKVSTKTEINRSLKALLTYEARLYKWSSKTALGVMKDKLNYEDSLIRFNTMTEAITIPFTETFSLFPSAQQKISITGSAIYSKLLTGSLDDLQRIYALVQYEVEPRWQKLFIKSFIQKEFTNVFTLPLIAGVDIKSKIWKENFILGGISSNYRMPTLNELYFTPGGNINLKPEISRNIEGGIESNLRNKTHSLKTTATLFTRDVKNWIVWYGGSILTPHNIQKVWSRGLEIDANYSCKLGVAPSLPLYYLEEVQVVKSKSVNRVQHASTLNLNVMYAYTLSTTLESAIANDYSIGKQIPYVPRYQVKFNIGLTKNAFDIHYVYAYTGYRFVTTDESAYLLPYNTHNIFASYEIPVRIKHQVLANCKVNNILNNHYESIIGRVMPGRTFSVGLNYKFRN